EYRLVLNNQEIDSTLSSPITVVPAAPWKLDVVIGTTEERVTTTEIPENTSNEGLFKTKATQAEDNTQTVMNRQRVPVKFIIQDEYGNTSAYQEGNTELELKTASATGKYYEQQKGIEPTVQTIIPRSQESITLFYEDEFTEQETDLVGIPTPPAGAREIQEATGKLKILSPDQLLVKALRDTIEVQERIAIELRLIDINGDSVFAPYPGLKLNLENTLHNGQFYLSDISDTPINAVRILPAVSSATIWYSNSDQGVDTVSFKTDGKLRNDPNEVLYITTGSPDLTRSIIMAEGGLVQTPHPLSLNLEDRYGNAITNKANLLKAEIIGGPNKGTQYSEFVEGEDGIYTTTYTPMISGYDSLLVSYDGMALPDSPVVISVLKTMPKSLEIVSGNNQIVTITDTTESALTVLVKDDFGVPYPGVKVMFMIESSYESDMMVEPKLVKQQAMTDSAGFAKVYLKVGSKPMTYRVKGALGTLPDVFFTVEAQQCVFENGFTNSTLC
ncbi:MAG: hypothetical protein EBR32_06645, partial [Bacteroidetes bacterium]|nr:hypothetical protein [Bacteroidota bacterium]